LTLYKTTPSTQNLETPRKSRLLVQKAARKCANDIWQGLCQEIQSAADAGDLKEMYRGIRQVVGPKLKKTAPLLRKSGEVLVEKPQQMKRWAEHFSDLYAHEEKLVESALDSLEQLPLLHSLDLLPTQLEVSKAIDSLKMGRAPG